MKNGDIRAFNHLAQEYAAQTGQTAPTDFDGVKLLVGDELSKAILGGAGALGDREEIQKSLSRVSSPDQLYSLVSKYTRLASGQLRGLEKQYQSSTGRDDFRKKLEPRTLEVFDKKSDEGGSKSENPEGAAAPPATGLPAGWSVKVK